MRQVYDIDTLWIMYEYSYTYQYTDEEEHKEKEKKSKARAGDREVSKGQKGKSEGMNR